MTPIHQELFKRPAGMFVAAGLVAAIVRLGVELSILERGPANSVSMMEAAYAFWVFPLLTLLAIVVAVGSLVSLLVLLRARDEERRELRSLAAGLLVAALLVMSAEWSAPHVRLARLAVITRSLEPEIDRYARLRANGVTATVPQLEVRGCTELQVVDGTWPEPSAADAAQHAPIRSRSWRPAAPHEAVTESKGS